MPALLHYDNYKKYGDYGKNFKDNRGNFAAALFGSVLVGSSLIGNVFWYLKSPIHKKNICIWL